MIQNTQAVFDKAKYLNMYESMGSSSQGEQMPLKRKEDKVSNVNKKWSEGGQNI